MASNLLLFSVLSFILSSCLEHARFKSCEHSAIVTSQSINSLSPLTTAKKFQLAGAEVIVDTLGHNQDILVLITPFLL